MGICDKFRKLAYLVEANVRFTRPSIPDQNTLLGLVYVQPKPEINLSKEQISDRLSQEIQTNILQQGFDVVPLINVSVLSKPTVEDRITNAR